ncbi:hypothetical protein O181_069302, partial [Austropuccinia psidii MF-1]|nr:hypothetical protein [Austropuccinia psidii MF-1]
LAQLCEFIEDCEFTKLSVRILHLLGVEGPKAVHPSKYIRYIYNRVILENAIVRAAAVSSLAKFGVNVPDLGVKASIKVLLTRCLDDVDDEVRDRAALYLKVLTEDPLADKLVKDESTISLAALESKLVSYISEKGAAQAPFEVSSIPRISKEQAHQEAIRARQEASSDLAILNNSSHTADKSQLGSIASAPSAAETQSTYAAQLGTVPEFSSYGKVLKSSAKPIPLTEHETEYVVSVVKHLFVEHIVFQFNLTNTLSDTVLEQVSVLMNPPDEGVTEDFIIPIPRISTEPGIIYVSYTRTSPDSFVLGSFNCTLKFVSKEVDPSSGEPEEDGYEDEYQLEDVEIGVGDYIIPTYVTFTTEWDRLRTGSTATETFQLSALTSLKSACETIIELLNMEPLGGTENPTSNSVHTLQLSGILCENNEKGSGNILVRIRMTFNSEQGVTMEMAIRAEKQKSVELVLSAIA